MKKETDSTGIARVSQTDFYNKEIEENFFYSLEIKKDGAYLIGITARAMSWRQNLAKFRLGDDDLAIKIDGHGFPKFSGKRGFFDAESAWNGNKLKGLLQTNLFLIYLNKGGNKIEFLVNQKPKLGKIVVYEVKEEFFYTPPNPKAENGNRRPWITLASKNTAIKNLSVMAKADEGKSFLFFRKDDSDFKLVIDGEIQKNETKKSHHNWFWCGKILKGNNTDFNKAINLRGDKTHYLEFFANRIPEIKEMKLKIGESGEDEQKGKIIVYKDMSPAVSEVYLRSKPNENGAIIEKIKIGEDIIIEELAVEGSAPAGLLSDIWHKISWNGESGFIHSSFIELYGQERKKIINFIKLKADELGIDRNLALNLAYCESKWLPFAHSETNNKGIYQLGEDTVKQINEKLGGDILDPYNPWQNIDGGLKYFKFFLDKYKDTANSMEKTITAWSRGPARVPYNKSFNIKEQPRGAQILLKCVLQGKTGEKIVKLFSAAILILVLGFGGYAYAFNKDDNAEWPPRTRRIYLNYGLVTALFDMRGREKVELETLKNDFDGDDVSEDIKFLEMRYRDTNDGGYVYITRVLSEKNFFNINGVFVSAEAIDLNKDGKNELVVTVIENKLYNMVILNYTDGELRPFPVFDTTGEYFNGIWSKFEIELQDSVNAPARIITSVPKYTGDYCEWKDMLKYYKWNGVGFQYYEDGERSVFSLDYCEDEPANGLIKVSGVEFE